LAREKSTEFQRVEQTVSTKVFRHVFFNTQENWRQGQYGIEIWLKDGEINSLAGGEKGKPGQDD